MTSHLDDLQLAVEHVYLSHDVEDVSIGLVVVGKLGCQAPIVHAMGQVHGLVVGRRLPGYGVNKPHREWLSGGIAYIGRGGKQVILENGVALLTESSKCKRDWAIAQLDVARLAHDTVGVWDGEVGESAMVLFESVGALCVGLTRHFHSKIGELLVKLLDLGLGLEVLEGTADGHVGEANGDGAKGSSVEFRVPLHDIERASGG